MKKCVILVNLFSQKLITKYQRIKEIEILNVSWTSLHPGLLRYNASSQIDQYFASKRRKS